MYTKKYFEGIELSDEQQIELIEMMEEIEESRKQLLVNISNHPSSGWSEEQKEGWESIIDIPFPSIHYDSNFDAIANSIYDQIRHRYHRTPMDCTVMVQGQHVATFAIVATLLACGFKVISAYTKRISTDNPDGTKTSKFVFGGYQNYSSPYIENNFLEELTKQVIERIK